MFANHARAAELRAARDRRAKEDAARAEDEQDQVPEPAPTSLEQFVKPGTRAGGKSHSPRKRGNPTRQPSNAMDAASRTTSEYDFSDATTDVVPLSTQASHSQASMVNPPTERIMYSTLRPSFSRTAQGYDTPSNVNSSPQLEPTGAQLPEPQRAFNPQAPHFTRPTQNISDDPFTEHRHAPNTNAYGHNNMSQASRAPQPSIRVTLPSAMPTQFNQPYPSYRSSENTQTASDPCGQPPLPPPMQPITRDPKPYTGFAASHGREQLLRSLYALPELEAMKGSNDSVQTAIRNPEPLISAPAVHSSVQTNHRDTISMQPGMKTLELKESRKDRSTFDDDARRPWKQRLDQLFKGHPNPSAGSEQPSISTTPKVPPGLNIPLDGRARGGHAAVNMDRRQTMLDVEDWWYRELKQRQDLHKHLADVARHDPFGHIPRGPGPGSGPGQYPGEGWALSSAVDGSDGVHVTKPVDDHDLFIAALSQLQSYVTGPDAKNPHRFGQYSGQVPEWCMDPRPGGNRSFFGDDWGAPPSRVGRDPRYRTTLHEGRYTVLEEGDRRPARA